MQSDSPRQSPSTKSFNKIYIAQCSSPSAKRSAGEPLISMTAFAVTKCSASLDILNLLLSSYPYSTAQKKKHKVTKTLCSKYYGKTKHPCVGRDSSVGIATRYRLDGPGIESRWRRDFPHPSRPALGPTQPTVQWVPVLSRG